MVSITNGTKTFYEMLGVPPDASTERIKEVYRDLARTFHPDSHFYDEIVAQKVTPEQEQIFKVITAAYNTLTDPQKRAEYDTSIKPLLNLRQKVKDWECEEEVFTPSRPLTPPPGSTQRTRKITTTFGRKDVIDAIEEQEQWAEPAEPSSKVSRFTLLVVGLGIVGGMFAGAAAYMIASLK